MKVLLRDEDERRYYRVDGSWVSDPAAAHDFQLVERAAQKATECTSQELAVVLRYESPECELALNPVFCVPASPGKFMLLPGKL